MEDTAAKPSLNLKTTNKTGLIWLDLEMTGLNPDSDSIIEIATVITDDNLNVLAEGPMLAIFTKQERLAAMDEWNTHQHSASGLIERVRASTISIADAEAQTLAFLQQWIAAGTSPMCGNSICQDRRFLAKHMPALERFFHYRNLDVSSVKELCQRWRPDLAFSKNSNHLALDDIYDSIAELRFYREHFFACNSVAIC